METDMRELNRESTFISKGSKPSKNESKHKQTCAKNRKKRKKRKN